MLTHKVDADSPVPLYRQIHLILREQIMTGEIPPNRRLPTHKELCTLYGVSRNSAARAVVMIEQEGLARFVHGKGIFVVSADELPPPEP
jgi:GntR family transcriptional regulator